MLHRQESWKNNISWFRKRINYSLAEVETNDYHSYFCIATFEKQKQQLYNERLYNCELHELEYDPQVSVHRTTQLGEITTY